MFRSRIASLLLVGLFLWATACASHQPIELNEVSDYDQVRVTLKNGEARDLYDPAVEDDVLKGRTDEAPVFYIPTGLVAQIDAWQPDTGQTVTAVLFGVLIVGLAVGYVALSEWASN